MVEMGDVVLLDGPKDYRAIRLALRLLSQGRVSCVYVHDASYRSREGRFFSAHIKQATFSDEPNFVAISHSRWSPVLTIRTRMYAHPVQKSGSKAFIVKR